MIAKIIIQILFSILFIGSIVGLIKLPKKQKLVSIFVLLLSIISTFLLWFIQ